MLFRSVLEELAKYKAALTVVIADTCFSFTHEKMPPVCGAPSGPRPLDLTHPPFRRLFFQTAGLIDINACSRGQVAVTHQCDSLGSIYTNSLVSVLHQYSMEEDTSFGWNELMQEVAARTDRSYRELFPNGQPIETEDDVVMQKTQTPYAFAMNIQQAAWNGNSGGNSLPSTRLGVEVRAYDGRVFVVSANSNGPATRLKAANDTRPWHLVGGDQIVSINDEAVDCLNCFSRAIRKSDARMSLVVRGDDGKLYPFTVTLDPFGADARDGGQSGEVKLRFGIWVETYDGPGAKVVKVQPNSPAVRVIHESGQEWFLEPGDIVTKVNGRETNGQDAVTSAVFASPKEMTIEVIGGRDGKTYRFKVQLWDVN